jgi:hypothetical protein
MSKIKELAEENRRLRRMCVEEKPRLRMKRSRVGSSV